MTPNFPGRWRAAVPYALACATSLAIFTWLMKLWQTNLHVPLTYYGEAMYNGLLVKTVLDFGWHHYNPALAAPGILNLLDVPTGDNNLYFLLIKIIGLFTRSYGLALNLFLLLTFPLVTWSAMYVLRRFGVSPLVAGCTALIYAFLPFHFVRGQHHIFFAAYFLVPLAVLLVLWVGLGRVSLFDETGRVGWRDQRLLGCAVICLLLSAGGTYFAFFTCLFLLLAAFLIFMRTQQIKSLILPAAFIAIIFGGLVVNLLPAITYLRANGDTPIIRRYTIDAEVYAFRIAQLFLPVSGHRLRQFARLRAAFNQRPWINENDDATLGLIGSAGFLILIGWMFIRKPEITRTDEDGTGGVISHLSIYNFTALMLGTFGGVGALISLLITTKIRAYNRISIFIAFFALTTIAILVDQFAARRVRTRQARLLFVAILVIALVLGVLDQFAPSYVPEHAKINAEFNSDARFMRTVQANFPVGAMIFQLPFVPFPENPKVARMYDYDHARGYLHTSGLRWSYGAVRGRADEVWQSQLTMKPTPEMIDDLVLSGFQAIYLNRNGYNEGPSKTETELIAALGPPRWGSDDGKLLLFDLREYEKGLRAKYAAEWDARREAALHPLLVVWAQGFSNLEGPPENLFRWSAAEGRLEIFNDTSRTRHARIELAVVTENDANLAISGALMSDQLRTSLKPAQVMHEVTIPPGRSVIDFKSDGHRVLAPGDFRNLVFKVSHFKLTPLD